MERAERVSVASVSIESSALALQRRAIWRLRWQRLGRVGHRLYSAPELSIFGCYDAGNVGDLALGAALAGIAGRFARTAFDSPRSSVGLSPPRAVVLAGGGVVTARPGSPLQAFSSYVGRRPCSVSVVGVSATLAEAELPEASLRTLRDAAWLSTRSQKSAAELARILGRQDIVVQPDIAFALRLANAGYAPPPRSSGRLLLNVSPFLHTHRGSEFVANTTPSAWFSKHLPEQAAWYDRIAPSYASLVDALVGKFLARGWEVVSVPLAPEDDLFARSLLKRHAVRHVPYDSDPLRVLSTFATAERALVTRFHAHVFAMLTRTPFASFAYSPKCSDLFAELGLPPLAQTEPRHWVHEADASLERLSPDGTSACPSEAALLDLEGRAFDLTRQGVLAALDHA